MSTQKDISNRFQDPVFDTLEDVSTDHSHLDEDVHGTLMVKYLETNFPKTLIYMGKENFQDIIQDYYQAHPFDVSNKKLFSRFFPQFLTDHSHLKTMPECGELAHLEFALITALDAPHHTPLTKVNFSRLSPNDWKKLTFKTHPSTSRLSLKTNASEIWSALHKEEELIESKFKALMIEIIVWRGNNMARFRHMNYDEAMIWDEVSKGANFAQICEMLGTYWPSEEAPLKAAGYLQGWIASEFLITSH